MVSNWTLCNGLLISSLQHYTKHTIWLGFHIGGFPYPPVLYPGFLSELPDTYKEAYTYVLVYCYRDSDILSFLYWTHCPRPAGIYWCRAWVLSLAFYGWCIKIVSILFICISSYITTHVFLFFNGHYLAQGIHQVCTSLQRCNDLYFIDLYLNWSFHTA